MGGEEVILLGGVMFKILIGFVGSFSDKGALHVPGGGGHFNKLHESGTKHY